MIALKILDKQRAIYSLENEKTNATYRLLFEFYNVKEPKIGDYIVLHKNLLDRSSEQFAQPYAFEYCEDKSFEEIKDLNSTEYALLVFADKKFVLRRIYG